MNITNNTPTSNSIGNICSNGASICSKLVSHIFCNIPLDINNDIDNVKSRTAYLLFWGIITPNQSGKHQPLKWCNPRFNGRGDDSVYNRSCIGLKTIVTVFGGFINSPIAKASINSSVFCTYFGNQSTRSFALLKCFRPFCFTTQGGIDG